MGLSVCVCIQATVAIDRMEAKVVSAVQQKQQELQA